MRKRNIELSKENNELSYKINVLYQELEDLKSESELNNQQKSENIKTQWTEVIKDLQQKQKEYQILIEELRKIKNIMVDMNFKIPWYKKIFKNKIVQNRGG